MDRTDAPNGHWRGHLFLKGPRVLFALLVLIITRFVANTVQPSDGGKG